MYRLLIQKGVTGRIEPRKRPAQGQLPGVLRYKDEIYNVGKDILCDIIYQIKKGPKALSSLFLFEITTI
jgi:hypothetical protein